MRHVRACLAIGVILWSLPARAADVGDLGGQPMQLDVTETSIAEKHFAARTPPGQTVPTPNPIEDSDWAGWINRLDTSLRWGHWDLSLRLDSALYGFRPVDQSLPGGLSMATQQAYLQQIRGDDATRFKNSIYPAKLWATYSAPGVEVTAGDAYVQFGRGLTLSMRKIDELGIDTTIRGGRVQITKDPFAITAVAGFANPSRVDEATGRALWVIPGEPGTPVYGSDRIVGVDLQAGRGLPLTLSTHIVRFSRCAPYHYDANGNLETSFDSDPSTVTFGTCNASDTDLWINSLNAVPRGLRDRAFTMAGQSIEAPSLWGHGTLYVEAAVQQRESNVPGENTNLNGNAIYAALAYDIGKTSSTLELKSNRNFYTVAASVGQQAPEFTIIGYSFLPPAESLNMIDAEGTGDFNACVEGGRFREDLNVSPDLLLYGQGVFAYSLTEQPNGHCDQRGRTITATAGIAAATVQDVVWDGVTGLEYSFNERLSHVFASVGARDDTPQDGNGDFQYREQHVEYSIAKYLGGPWSLEIQGRHRHRKEKDVNIDPTTYAQPWWYEGENYVSLRMAPKWVFTGGFEYTTLIGQPTTYVNGAVVYKFTSSSNLRVFVGEQRGAFRCASGICRFFPAFEGARAELTLRF